MKVLNLHQWPSKLLSQWEVSTKKDETFAIASPIAYLGDSFFVIIWSEDGLQDLEYTWDQGTIWATAAASGLSDLEEE